MTKRGWRSNDGSITSVDPGNLLVPPIFTKLYQVTHVQYQVTHVFYQVTHVLTLKWLTQTNIIVMASLVACWIIHLPPPYIKLHTTQGAYKSMPYSIYIHMHLQDQFTLIGLSRKMSYRAQVPSRQMWWSVTRITWEHYRRWSR